MQKLQIENRTFTKIVYDGRIEDKLLNPVALKEAVINAIVHNNYTSEVPPKFELFSDRIEIISTGGIQLELSQEEFLAGISKPVNKILMRVFRDLDLVEQLGSGIPRILKEYKSSSYHFSDNFIRVTFSYTNKNDHPTPQAKLLEFCKKPKLRDEIQKHLELKDREYFRKDILKPLIQHGKIRLTIPEKPTSPKQRYITVDKEK